MLPQHHKPRAISHAGVQLASTTNENVISRPTGQPANATDDERRKDANRVLFWTGWADQTDNAPSSTFYCKTIQALLHFSELSRFHSDPAPISRRHLGAKTKPVISTNVTVGGAAPLFTTQDQSLPSCACYYRSPLVFSSAAGWHLAVSSCLPAEVSLLALGQIARGHKDCHASPLKICT